MIPLIRWWYSGGKMVTPSVDTLRADFDQVGRHNCESSIFCLCWMSWILMEVVSHLFCQNMISWLSTFCQVGDVSLQNLKGLQGNDNNERMCISIYFVWMTLVMFHANWVHEDERYPTPCLAVHICLSLTGEWQSGLLTGRGTICRLKILITFKLIFSWLP